MFHNRVLNLEAKCLFFRAVNVGATLNPEDFAKLPLRPLLCGCVRNHSEFQADNDISNDTVAAAGSYAFSGHDLSAESKLFLVADPDRPHCIHGDF